MLKEGVSREDVQEVKATFRDMGVDIEVPARAAVGRFQLSCRSRVVHFLLLTSNGGARMCERCVQETLKRVGTWIAQRALRVGEFVTPGWPL